MSLTGNRWKTVSLRPSIAATRSAGRRKSPRAWDKAKEVAHLPLEIWLQIAQHFDNIDDLLALGLTCRALSAILRNPLAWQRASIRIYCPVFTQMQAGSFSYVQVVQDLRLHGVYYIKPHILDKLKECNIRRLTLCGPNIRVEEAHLEVFVKQCPFVEELTLINCSMNHARFSVLNQLPHLTKCVIESQDKLCGLGALSCITDLELRQCFFDTAVLRGELAHMPNLRRICITGGRGLTPRLKADLQRLHRANPQLPTLIVEESEYCESRYRAFKLPLDDPDEFPSLTCSS